jgi:DNA-binding CsgD family transcriptional regulator
LTAGPESDEERQELLELLEEKLRRLTPGQQQLWNWMASGCKPVEIARKLCVSYEVARRRQRRVIAAAPGAVAAR